jgi:CRP/FNR family transcriptional regulator, cyclic AMP receptor protein
MLSVIETSRTERIPASSFHSFRASDGKTPYGLPVVENCVSTVLRRSNPDCCLSDKTLAELDRIKHASAYPEGAMIFVEGQTPRGVYVLCQGRAKLMSTNRDGKTFIMKIAQPGEILGLHAVVSGQPYELAIETLQPSQLAFIDRNDFLRFLRQNPDACLHAAQQLSNDCASAYEVIRSIGLSHSVSEKLARLLLQWSSEAQPVNGTIRLKLALTHEEMAQLIGSSRETVSRLLGDLKRQRVLELSGSTMLIRNKAALEKLVQ